MNTHTYTNNKAKKQIEPLFILILNRGQGFTPPIILNSPHYIKQTR